MSSDARDRFLSEYLMGNDCPPGSETTPAGGRTLIEINPGQVDAFERFLQDTQDRLAAARHKLALSRIQALSLDQPPELKRIINYLDGAVRLLGTTADTMTSGASYAGKVAQLARKADAPDGMKRLEFAKAGKSLVAFAADPKVNTGADALLKAINIAIGGDLVLKTTEVVVGALTGASGRNVAGEGVQRVLRQLGEGVRRAVTPAIGDREKFLGDISASGANSAKKVLLTLDKFSGPAGAGIDILAGGGALKDMFDDGPKVSSGLGVGSSVTGLLSAAALFSGWGTVPAVVLGGTSVTSGLGSDFAKGKEDEADRREAREAFQEKLRRNPNTTEVLRGLNPVERFAVRPPAGHIAPDGGVPSVRVPRLQDFPPLPPVEDVPPLQDLPRLSPTPP